MTRGSRRPVTPRSLTALALASSLVSILAVSALASATGPTPVPPNPSSPQAQDAVRAIITGDNAYTETFQFNQLFHLVYTTCGTTCFQLYHGYANITSPVGALPTAHLVNPTYSIAMTTGCGGSCSYTVTCDGAPAPAPSGASGCFSAELTFQGDAIVTAVPVLNLTRTQEWSYAQAETWIGTSDGASLTSQVESWPPTIFGHLSTIHLTSWAVPQVSWAVPLPQGSYDLSKTAVEFLNTSTMLTSSEFGIESTWFLIQWTYFPVSERVGTEPVAHAPVLSYEFSLTDTVPPVTGGGGIIPPLSQNSTIPPNVTLPVAFNTAVQFQTLNITAAGAGNYTASAILYDRYSFPLVGPYYFASPLWAHATNVTVTVNGQPVPGKWVGMFNNTVMLYPGSVTVASGNSSEFTIFFGYVAQFNPLAPIGIVDGFTVTVGDVIAGLFGAAALVLYVAEFYSPTIQRSRVAGTAEGALMLGALVMAWIYL